MQNGHYIAFDLDSDIFQETLDIAKLNLDGNIDYVELFLKNQENWFSDMLVTKGHVFLNEVRVTLGLPITAVGQLVGWTSANTKRISFNMEDLHSPAVKVTFKTEGIILKYI